MARNLIPDNFITQLECKQRDAVEYTVPVANFRVHDAFQTALSTASSDDLGVATGTLGTAGCYLTSGNAQGTALTQYARFQFVLPPEYYAGETVKVRLYCDMTTAATVSATADVQAYKQSVSAGTVGSDLCTTAALSINSTTAAAKDFTITSTSLSPGDVLDIRIAVAISDGSGSGTVTALIYQAAMLLDIRG